MTRRLPHGGTPTAIPDADPNMRDSNIPMPDADARLPTPVPSIRTLLVALTLASFAFPAAAKTCSDAVVHAAGEPASYEWLARIKTHANWRAKVRSLPGLGDPYANWSRAENSTERCYSGPSGTVCEFTGTPCRKD